MCPLLTDAPASPTPTRNRATQAQRQQAVRTGRYMDLTDDVTDKALDDIQQQVDAAHDVKQEGRLGQRAAAQQQSRQQLLVLPPHPLTA